MAILIKPSVDPGERWIEVFADQAPDEEVRIWPDWGAPEEIEFAIVRRPPAGSLEAFRNLRWVASIPAGVEPLLEPGVVPASVPLIRCVSPNRGAEMAEYVLMQTLRIHRRALEYEAMVKEGGWSRLPQPATHERRVGVMGLGELGSQVAAMLASAGLSTAGWTRTPRSLDGVANFHGDAQFDAFLGRTDILVCVLPLTADTDGIVNANTLAKLPTGATVINVSRGAHVVEQDLIDAIDRGHISGACLDVLSVEPPPPDLPVVRHPRILVTPHIACRSRAEQLLPALLDNMDRARKGRALNNLVDRARGY